MTITRRALLGASAATGIVAAAGLPAHAAPAAGGSALPVVADNGLVALPKGFKINRVSTIGAEDLLADRFGAVIGKTPSNLDGTGAFDVPGGVRLVVNHECRASARIPVPLVEGTVYDDGVPGGMGGNTVVETDSNGRFVQQWVALSGTIRNCAGGETPWGSWLACEEDVTKAGTTVTSSVDGQTYTTKKDHGYVFEVFPDVVAKQVPLPIKAWGRAVWEGAAIDPDLTKAYITEDTGRGLLYRWTAPEGAKIGPRIAEQFGENDGVLQAAQLVRDGVPLVHYGQLTAADVNKPYPVKWLDGGADRQAQNANLRDQYPGATQHPKIEGCWNDANGMWFTLSYTNASQIAQYKASHGIDMLGDSGMIAYYNFADETITIKEYWANGNAEGFHGPDNITVSPWGGVVIAEDGNDPCSLVAFTERLGSNEIARDLGDRGEWAGPAFAKGGSLLFASIQGDCTYAISGPMAKYLNR
ncbi:alkaline phosphatase PhoX [Propionibacteriaceae bacterium G57]|uniref:alkaline phosphatase PhoX n=1 Tax=Aestuariimicrobium sp. G57 TaxID=3418485 RepID=UPI003DA767C7